MSSQEIPVTQFIVIQIEWHGPFLINEVLQGNKKLFNRIGLYQIYGDHPINGSDNLLYLGHTLNSFKARLKEHYNVWMKHEFADNQIYFGVIWGNEKMEPDKEHLFIRESEKLLTYYSAPPYNSSLVYDMNQSEIFRNDNILVINLWQKHLLPYEVSTLWYHSDCWKSRRELLKLEE